MISSAREVRAAARFPGRCEHRPLRNTGQGIAGFCRIFPLPTGNAPLCLRLAAHPPPLAGEALSSVCHPEGSPARGAVAARRLRGAAPGLANTLPVRRSLVMQGCGGKICRWIPGRCEHRPLRKAGAACIAYRSRQGIPNGLQGKQAAGPGAAGCWCCGGQPAAIALASSSPMKIFSSAAVNPRSTQLCTVTARLNLPGRQKFSTSLGMVRSKTTASGNSAP